MKTKIIIAATVIIGVILILSLQKKLYSKFASAPANVLQKTTVSQDSTSDSPQIISTKPDPLENHIISTDEVVEITFNRPLQNKGEFKLRIEPKIKFDIKLSDDRKTANIIPLVPYQLGTTYTIFIGPATKFDGTGDWGQEKIFHFHTIRYRGV